MGPSVLGLAGWIVSLAALGLQGRSQPPALQPFQGRLAEALELGAERNVPILCVTLFEGDDWDPREQHDLERLRRELLEEADVARGVERGLLVLACNRVHELETVKVQRDGARVEVQRCSAYWTDSCSVHQRLFEDVFATWNEDGVLVTPFLLVLDPAGQVSKRWSDGHAPPRADLLAGLEAVRAKAGAGLTAPELLQVRGAEADALAGEARGDPGAAWRAWTAVLAVAEATPHAARARLGLPRALAQFEARREAARAEVGAGRAVAGYELLSALLAQGAGTPVERELKKELRALETHPEHKAAIAAHKRELAAQELLREVEALVAAGEERKAGARVAQLLRRFEDTRAAAAARERYAHLIK